MLSQGFEINEDNKQTLDILFRYFTGDKSIEDEGYSLNKGILLTGSIGTGKTTIFELLNKFLKKYRLELYSENEHSRNFRLIDSRHVVRDFHINGMKTLDEYGRKCFLTKHEPIRGEIIDYSRPVTYCFDDLGLEEVNANLYGNKMSVMIDIMLDRYSMFKSNKMITHAISNLSIENLAKLYGDRAIDRFKELFNHLVITGKSLRK